MPVTMFRNERSSENGVNGISLELIFARSCMSLFRRACICNFLVLITGCICQAVQFLHCHVVNCCNWHGHIVQSERCSSVIPIPCVKPPLVLKDLISVCSLLTTCRPFTNFKYTSGCLFFSSNIS